jgi:hypothetical protein
MTLYNRNTPSSAFQKVGSFRWIICSLLLFSTTVNYMDRQVIGYLKKFFCTPSINGGFGWNNSDYANLTAFFTLMYACTTIFAGWFIDKIILQLSILFASSHSTSISASDISLRFLPCVMVLDSR